MGSVGCHQGWKIADTRLYVSFGHCSLAHPSLCTAKHARAYFTQGKVPESGSTCKSDPRYLFPTPNSKSYELDRVEHGDAELRTALEGLMDAVPRLLR